MATRKVKGKDIQKKRAHPRCAICKHPMREAIESIAMVGGYSWSTATKHINREFDTDFTVSTVRNHMLNHEKSETVIRAGVYLGEVMGEDKYFNSHGVLRLMILQAMQKVAKGEIEITSVQELMNAIMLDKTYIEMYDRNARLADENGQTQQFMAQIGILAKALKENVDPAQLETALRAAMTDGMRIDMQTVEPDYHDSAIITEKNVVEKYLSNGSQQAEDLDEAGVLDNIKDESGVNIVHMEDMNEDDPDGD